jgi:hypothetical protein
MGIPQGYEVFNEVELRYSEASIKLRSTKTHVKAESKQLTRLARNSASVSCKVSEP